MKNLLIFVAGATVGSLVTYIVVRRKDERLRKEEIEQVREYYKEKENNNEKRNSEEDCGEGKGDRSEDSINGKGSSREDQKEISENNDSSSDRYSDYVEEDDEPDVQMIPIPGSGLPYPAPYIIESDQFGDQDGYETAGTWYFYQNGYLIDSLGHEVGMSDRDAMIGNLLTTEDALDHIDVESAVYIRNEKLKMDFEILFECEDYIVPHT